MNKSAELIGIEYGMAKTAAKKEKRNRELAGGVAGGAIGAATGAALAHMLPKIRKGAFAQRGAKGVALNLGGLAIGAAVGAKAVKETEKRKRP